jgi:hypothetical protein
MVVLLIIYFLQRIIIHNLYPVALT